MKKFAAVAALSVIAFASAGQSSDSIAYQAAGQSPQVQAAGQRCEAFTAEAAAANSLPGIEADFDYKFGKAGVENRWGVSVAQQFDWPGLYAARSKAAKIRANAFELDKIEIMRGKWLEAKLAIINLQQSAATLRIARQAVQNLTDLSKAYQWALSRGETTILEAKKTAMQLARAEIEFARARGEHQLAQAAYNALWVNASDIPQPAEDIESAPLLPENTYSNAYINGNAGLLAARQRTAAAEADIKTAKMEGMPSFKLAYTHDFEEGNHFNGFGIGISLPTWRPKAAVKAAQALHRVAEFEQIDADIIARAKVSADYAEAKALFELIKPELRDESYPELLRKALDAGRITLFQYLTDYNDYLEMCRQQIETESNYAAAEARLRQYVVFDINAPL